MILKNRPMIFFYDINFCFTKFYVIIKKIAYQGLAYWTRSQGQRPRMLARPIAGFEPKPSFLVKNLCYPWEWSRGMREGTQKLQLHAYIRWCNNLTVLVIKKSLILSARRDWIRVQVLSELLILNICINHINYSCWAYKVSRGNTTVLDRKSTFLAFMYVGKSWIVI